MQRDRQGRGWWCSLPFNIFFFLCKSYFEWNPSPKDEICSYEMDVAKGPPAQPVSLKWGADGRNFAAALLQNLIEKLHNLPHQLTKGIPTHVGKQLLLSQIWQFPICNSSKRVFFYMWIEHYFVGLVLLYTYNWVQEIISQHSTMEFPSCFVFSIASWLIKDYIRSYHPLEPLSQWKKEEVKK